MRELVEYIAASIVDHPEEVIVSEVPAREGIILRLEVAPDDVGKVIGRDGRIIKAIRSVLRVASLRAGHKVIVEIGS